MPQRIAKLRAHCVLGGKVFINKLVLIAALSGAPDFHVGPSCSLMEVKPGNLHPVELAPGLGVQGGLDWSKWTLDVAFLGSLTSLETSVVSAASTALFACYKPYGTCVGTIFDAANSVGYGFLQGKWSWRQSFGIVFSLAWEALTQLHATTAVK